MGLGEVDTKHVEALSVAEYISSITQDVDYLASHPVQSMRATERLIHSISPRCMIRCTRILLDIVGNILSMMSYLSKRSQPSRISVCLRIAVIFIHTCANSPSKKVPSL